jgi:hypothetical protein
MNGQPLLFPFSFLIFSFLLFSLPIHSTGVYLFFGLEGALSLGWKSPINLPRHLLFAVFSLIGCPFSSCPSHPPSILFFLPLVARIPFPVFIYGKRLKSAG